MPKITRKRKFVLGVTGGIASGKTTVIKMLSKAGIPTIGSDDIAHDCIRRGRPGYRAILRSFGEKVLGRRNEIDRKILGKIIFADRKARRRLEKIVHPCVIGGLRRFIREHRGVVVLDIPLLYEARLEALVDQVLVVNTSQDQQILRLRRRDGLCRQEALQRLAAQMPLSAKCDRAGFVLQNTGSRALLRRRLAAYLCMIRIDAGES